MFRSLTAVALTFALQGGALSASLVHAHLDDHDEEHHHGLRVVHAHLGGHHFEHHQHDQSSRPRVLERDDDVGTVSYLHVFLAVHPASVVEPSLPPEGFAIPPLHESVMRRAPDVVRSHGPPAGGSADSRAPPTFLS